MQKHLLKVDGSFHFEVGAEISGLEIVYHTSPREYKEGDKVVWICHALTANSDVEDWWPQLAGPGKLVDTDKYFVVCVNMLTSPYGSSGPVKINPATGDHYFLNFPQTTVRDVIAATILVRKHLGISQIDTLIGSSIGGFQAVEWLVTEPEVFKNAVLMATAPRVSPWLTAENEAQRMALEADPTFREAKSLSGGADGLRCARAQALITYRSYDGYRLTQSESDVDTLFAERAASYERHQGDKIVNRAFDAYSYWYLTKMLDSHNVGRGRGGVEAALSGIKAHTCVISVESDGIFPPSEGKKWAPMIPGSEYHVITSDFGHDGFLLETEQIVSIIKNFL